MSKTSSSPLAILLIAIFSLFLLASCGGEGDQVEEEIIETSADEGQPAAEKQKNASESPQAKKIRIANRESKNRNPRDHKCNTQPGPDPVSPQCTFGEGKVKAVVLGDNLAMPIVSALQNSMGEAKGSILFLGAKGCHALLDVSNHYFANCHEYNAWVKKKLANDEKLKDVPLVIINDTAAVLSGKSSEEKYYKLDGIMRGTEKFKAKFTLDFSNAVCELAENHPVYLVRPTPKMPVDVPEDTVAKLKKGKNDFASLTKQQYRIQQHEAINLFSRIQKKCEVVELNPAPFLCKGDDCPGTDNGRPLYYDRFHLSEFGNKRLTGLFKKIWRDEQKATGS